MFRTGGLWPLLYQFLLIYFFDLGTLSADFTELLTIKLSLYIASRSLRDSPSRGYPISEIGSII